MHKTFALFVRMKPGICSAYSLRNLTGHDVLICDAPVQALTFVENHDVVRDSPLINDKLLAYAFILTHEGCLMFSGKNTSIGPRSEEHSKAD
jgi:alpha-amylase